MTAPADTRQLSLLPPEAACLLHLVRENLRLLAELVTRYEVGRVGAPADERVVLLDTTNHLLGTQLVYQGGLNSTAIRLADCFREAVARGAASVVRRFTPSRPSQVR